MAPRRPWLAAVMSLLLPGLGQLYNGEVNRAIWTLLIFLLGALPIPASIALWLAPVATGPALLVAVLFAFGVWLWAVADAWRGARARTGYRLPGWQRSGVYALVFVFAHVITMPLLLGWVRDHLVRAFKVPSASMMPSILPGDHLFADMRYNCPGCASGVHRGDIAIFIDPNDRTRFYVKRIIGLPGDEVRIAGGAVSVNGEWLSRPARGAASGEQSTGQLECIAERCWMVNIGSAASQADKADSDRAPALTVPAGAVYLLGDNRVASVDSRKLGPVPLVDVVGRVRQIYFSHGENGIRWSRIGALPSSSAAPEQ
ncbi:MAG: signal peptidase I [Burkholderiaceae bacterium]